MSQSEAIEVHQDVPERIKYFIYLYETMKCLRIKTTPCLKIVLVF